MDIGIQTQKPFVFIIFMLLGTEMPFLKANRIVVQDSCTSTRITKYCCYDDRKHCRWKVSDMNIRSEIMSILPHLSPPLHRAHLYRPSLWGQRAQLCLMGSETGSGQRAACLWLCISSGSGSWWGPGERALGSPPALSGLTMRDESVIYIYNFSRLLYRQIYYYFIIKDLFLKIPM